jgi:hypothetical protein
MNLAHYLGLLHQAESTLATAFRDVAEAHRDEPDVVQECQLLAGWSDRHAADLLPFVDRYGGQTDGEPERLHTAVFGGTREGGLALLRDLHDLYLMVTECQISWVLVGQAAAGIRDGELGEVVTRSEGETTRQSKWLLTRMKQAAPQALVVA